MTGTVLILGATGKIGTHSAHAFQEAGWSVKLFDRQNDDFSRSARDVDVIVNGLNPKNYHNWQQLIPKITHNVIEAAKVNNALVILPGNVYHFGDQPGIWSQDTPPNPISRKGQIRLDMERAYRASGVKTLILRAGNFIDPNRNKCMMSLMYRPNPKNNKITLPGPKHVMQAMCYLPDWARAAVLLANRRNSLKRFEDIPFKGHSLSAELMKSTLEELKQEPFTFTKFPWWIFSLTSPFWELAREMNEMRYLWHTNHELCDKRLKSLLPGFEPTPLTSVLTCAIN